MQDEGSILFRPNVSIKKGLGCSFSCDETMACYIVHVIGFGASNRNMLSYSSHKTKSFAETSCPERKVPLIKQFPFVWLR